MSKAVYPFVAQYIDGKRCLVARNFVESSHWILQHACIESGDDGGLLRNFEMTLHENYFNAWLLQAINANSINEILSLAQIAVTGSDGVWTAFCNELERTALCVHWVFAGAQGANLHWDAEEIYVFGEMPESATDRLDGVLDFLLNKIDGAEFGQGRLSLRVLDFALSLVFATHPENMPTYDESAYFGLRFEKSTITLEYDAERSAVLYDESIKSKKQATGDVQSMPECEALFVALLDEEQNSAKLAAAIEECSARAPDFLLKAMLYCVTLYDTALDPELVLALNKVNGEQKQDALYLVSLYNIYSRNERKTLLLDLYPRVLTLFKQSPQNLLRYSIEMAELFSLRFGLHSRAAQILLSIKGNVMQQFSNNELISFAFALHLAQRSNHAIHILRRRLKLCSETQECATLIHAIVRIMRDHSDPLQNIINMCRKGLSYVPNHIELLLILGQSLALAEQVEAAAEAYELALQAMEQKMQRELELKHVSGDINFEAGKYSNTRRRAIGVCMTLESLYQIPQFEEQRTLLMLRRLRLEPHNYNVFLELLRLLERQKAYAEMASICEQFLQRNEEELHQEAKISVYLNLYRIFEQQLDSSTQAMHYLDLARALDSKHPSVLAIEVHRAQQSGHKSDELTYRQLLLEQLQGTEAVQQLLELAQIYETQNNDNFKALKCLRKALAIDPQNIDILMSLRRNLRKAGQDFELAWVLERLANLSNDVQKRRSFLLEAAEIHAKQHNRLLAEKLYNEAQLCSPINPASAPAFALAQFAALNPSPMIHGPEQNYIYGYDDSLLHPSTDQAESSISLSLAHDDTSTASTEHSQASFMALRTASDNEIPIFTELEEFRTKSDVSSELALEAVSIADEVKLARKAGDDRRLFKKLKQLVESLPENEQNPRMLQEIGCIALYDLNDKEEARKFLEKAAKMDENIANGEQTLNALEEIYEFTKDYEKLAKVYEKKYQVFSFSPKRRKYEIRLAQLHFEQLKQTELALITLERLREENPQSEGVLSLLARIYAHEKRFDEALNIQHKLAKLYPPHSKSAIASKLTATKLLAKLGRWEEAKSALIELLEEGENTDRLGIIEQYKRFCRQSDDWDGLLKILARELAYYLAKTEAIDVLKLSAQQLKNLQSLAALHAIREYADILYLKQERIEEAILLYSLLVQCSPNDPYSFNILREIAENYEDSSIAIAFDLQEHWPLDSIIPTHEELEIAVSKSKEAYAKLRLALSFAQQGKSHEANRLLFAVREQSGFKENNEIIGKMVEKIEGRIEEIAKNSSMKV
ncbi:MAG: hypothetical protein ACOX8U_07460 [Bradymonadia bacterium]|jgi:tetratricopeptide (TPR) repeat protein